MNENLIALLCIVVVIGLIVLAEYTPKLWHLAVHHHWPFFQYLGFDKHGFDEYGDECLRCR